MPGGFWGGWRSSGHLFGAAAGVWRGDRGSCGLELNASTVNMSSPSLSSFHRLFLFVVSFARLPIPQNQGRYRWFQGAQVPGHKLIYALVPFWEGALLPSTNPQRETPPPPPAHTQHAYLCPGRWNGKQTFLRQSFE